MSRKEKPPKPRRDKHGRLYCNATSKNTGRPCKAYAMRGRVKCYHHGGKTPRGIASPHTIHGKYSKDLPTRLFSMMIEELKSPDLLNLTNEIALTDVRLRDLASQLGERSPDELIEEMYNLFEGLDVVVSSMNKGKVKSEDSLGPLNQVLESMRELFSKSRSDLKTWREIQSVQDHRRKLIEAENKRVQTEAETLSMRELALVMRSISEIIIRNVDDESIRESISEELTELLDPGNISIN